MSNRIKNNLKNLVGQTLNQYYSKVKPTISDLRYKQEYQNRIIECMVGEVDDNYITTPETDSAIVKLEHSKEGLVKVPSIKGKTILIDADGNETDTPGEGCRLVSVGEEDNKLIILSKNKNLFNGNYTFDKWGNKVTEYIYIKGLTSISHSTTSMDDGALISTSRFYDKNKNLIKDNGNNWNNRKIDIPNGAEYIKYSIKPTVDINTFMVESGSIITNYVPHQSHKTEFLLNEPLRSLPNGICDEIVGNKLIRRVGKIIFKGNESWRWGEWSNNERAELYGSDLNIINLKNKGSLKCNMFKVLPHSNAINDTHIDCIMCGKYISIFIDANRLVTNDLKGAKLWLSENPMEVLYELAEPIIEELPNGITLQGFDDTTMYIENSITPTVSYGYNALIPYKQELSNQKEEVETNTLDIEQNIIPYLMDMEFNLMLMEDE